jgi:hypothetical protein
MASDSDEPNYFWHAFKLQYNVIGLGTALGFAILSGSLLPLIVAAGVEMIVLPMLAGNPRFQNVVKAEHITEVRAEEQGKKLVEASEMLRALPDGERRKYQEMMRLSGEIRQNYHALDESSQTLLEELVAKLDSLMSFYLRMRYSLARYDTYFASTDRERIQERIAMLEHEMVSGPERIQQIKAKTKEVLEKRLERYDKALENKQLIEAQTEAVQEALQLLRDQSFSIKDPRSITGQLDDLVSKAEVTERGVQDLEALFDIEGDFASWTPGAEPPVAPTEALHVAPKAQTAASQSTAAHGTTSQRFEGISSKPGNRTGSGKVAQ